ncbi:YggT family protein [Halioxenophilus aromaticivorans]|uniref:YggT family protein n=1 Tax=Halioxenophilus aromaticivorans TaxID=1306992 RepID=A0AAV3U010_9ALTE
MDPLAQIATLVIQTVASIYLFFVVIRFLLQLARADFYNPISQAVVKATNPVLIPLRKIIPGLFGIDMAALVLAVIVGFVAIELNALAAAQTIINPARALFWAIIGVLKLATMIVFVGLIITIIVSWVAPYSSHPALTLLNQLMEPVRAPFARIIPPMGGLDLSPIFIFLTVQVIWILLDWAAMKVGLVGGLAQFVPGY